MDEGFGGGVLIEPCISSRARPEGVLRSWGRGLGNGEERVGSGDRSGIDGMLKECRGECRK